MQLGSDEHSELDALPDDFPEDFFKLKILPELLKSVEFGGGGPKVFGAVMKIATKMSDDEFESKLAPVIIRLFASPDRAMRVCLLDNLPRMIDRLSSKDVNNKIFPAMVTGFTDTAPVVREQTVKAVLTVITKLSDRTINGDLLRYLAKTANDEQPGIRTNTTICLGKIARNLGVNSRARVLIAAFTRSLRDPFVHARNAALMALNVTIDIFSDDDCAMKILPVLCSLLIDKEKLVRDQANKTFDTYLHRVRKFGSTMPDSVMAAENEPAGNSKPVTRIGNQSDTSWAGWAISSFTNKLASARGEMQQPVANGNATQTSSRPPSGRATPTPKISLISERDSVASRPSTAQTSHSSISHPDDFNEANDLLEAWGSMDEEGDSFFEAPVSARKAPTRVPTSPAFDDGGEPDFAGWLAAQAQAKSKSKSPLPKGLSKPSATMQVRPTLGERSRSSGPGSAAPVAVATASKRPRNPLKSTGTGAPTKPKPVVQEPDPNDDDWGEAWE